MTRFVFSLALIAAACTLPVLPAHAQSRVFVAAQGSDSNPCTFALPCRTFQHAHDVVVANGEIDVLDPAGYGALTISKAISIQGHGFSGISVASGATGITINAAAADDINLNGLLIDGAGVGQIGVRFNRGNSLTIENCVARNLQFYGIYFAPNATSSLSISHSVVANNSGYGIYVAPTGIRTVSAMFNRVETNHNGSDGILLYGGSSIGIVTGTVVDSVAAGNGTGFEAITSSGHAPATLILFHSVAADNINGAGVSANGLGAVIRLDQTMLTGNTAAWTALNGGSVSSYGNNAIDGNMAGDPPPPGTPLK